MLHITPTQTLDIAFTLVKQVGLQLVAPALEHLNGQPSLLAEQGTTVFHDSTLVRELLLMLRAGKTDHVATSAALTPDLIWLPD